jgi:hypothetical protein
MKKRHIITIITAITGDRVVVGKTELEHALRHFPLPEDILLELLERVLKDPTDVYLEKTGSSKQYKLFYRLEKTKYLLVVVKLTNQGSFFASMYPTGVKVRGKHKNLKKVKI